jgi:hypothetical protein
MKDCNGKEIKVGDSVKFVCTLEDLMEVGILEDDGTIILDSIGTVCKNTPHEEAIEVHIDELGWMNYWFFDNMIELV